MLALFRDEAPSICASSWKWRHIRGTTCQEKGEGGEGKEERRQVSFGFLLLDEEARICQHEGLAQTSSERPENWTEDAYV